MVVPMTFANCDRVEQADALAPVMLKLAILGPAQLTVHQGTTA